MRKFKKTTRVLLFVLAISFNSFSQNSNYETCPFVDAGPDVSNDCSTGSGCATLTATYYDIKESTSYIVEQLNPDPPIAYNQAGGTGVSINQDDRWSSVIDLPFPFCFYGQTYNALLIGSNGNLTFTLTEAGNFSPWSFTASCPSPNLVAAGNIFGVYHDIDPTKGIPQGTIRWYLVGQEPCRQLIVVFNNLAHFGTTCGANSFRSSHMIVLNETTNYIDVFVNNKPTCNGWNGGRAILGIQNLDGSQGITAPNRNSSPNWTVNSPEAWRFKPDGTPLYTIEWLEGLNVISTQSSVQVCPGTETTYTARFTYTSCGNPDPVVLTDDVTVTPPPGAITATLTTESSVCGQANGSVTVTASGGQGLLTYSMDNQNFGNNSTFENLLAGNYTVYVTDNIACTLPLNFTISDNSTLTANISNITNVSCFGGNNGAFDINVDLGNPPYSYTINQVPGTSDFSIIGQSAGQYAVAVSDNLGCLVNLSVTITEPNQIVLTEQATFNSSCNLPNGGLSVQGAGGTAPLVYSIDNFQNIQNGGTFIDLLSGDYYVVASDLNNCKDSILVTVAMDPTITLSIQSFDSVTCYGYSDGVLSVIASVGPEPYTFSLNGQELGTQSTFNGLPEGLQIISVRDGNGCIDTIHFVMPEPSKVIASTSPTETICRGTQILLQGFADGGTPPYSYLWNNVLAVQDITPTPPNTGTYTLKVTDANGCVDSVQVTQTVLPIPQAAATASPSSGFAPLEVSFSNQSTNGTSFLWNFGNGLNGQTSSLNSPVTTTYFTEDTFYVEMIATNGICSTIWTETIVVIPYLSVEVPNVFTPNGNSVNDGYQLIMRNATGIEATIVNRWGNVVKEFTKVTDFWDGKNDNGNDHSDGVYFIKYKVYGYGNQEISGQTFFHLIR